MAKEKVRTTIGLEKDLYDELDKRGIIKGRKISELVNQLLLEYIQTESINQLELRSRNFIEDSINRAMTRNMAAQENQLAHIYSSAVYSALLLTGMNSLSDAEYQKLLKDMNTESTRFASGMVYKEEFIRQNPFMSMRDKLIQRSGQGIEGRNTQNIHEAGSPEKIDEIDFDKLFGDVEGDS